MKKVLITTSSFAKHDPSLLEKLEQSGYQVVLNPYGRKLSATEARDLLT